MLLKFIALISAAIPVFLFLRSIFGGRPTKIGNAMREAKKQVDLGINIFIAIIGVVVAIALGRLAWVWWTAL